MKSIALFAAVIAGAVTITAAPAGAFAPAGVTVAPVVALATDAEVSDYHRTERRTTRTHYYGQRARWGWRTNCRTQYRHGHRERVCRKIRYQR